jgi:hypothetical protein
MDNLVDYIKIYQILSSDECDYILNEVKDDNFYRATTTKVEENNLQPQVDNYRTNTQTFIQHGTTSDRIVYERIALSYSKWIEDLPDIPRNIWRNNYRNVMDTGYEINKYEKDQYYDTHIDVLPTRQVDRILSLVVYLNDDYEGGAIEFPFFRYQPKKGEAIVFPSNWLYPHKSTSIIKGTKYSLVTWVVNNQHM